VANELKRDPAELRRLHPARQPSRPPSHDQQRFDRELVAASRRPGGTPRLGSRIDQLTVLLALVAHSIREYRNILGLTARAGRALFEEADRLVQRIDNTLIACMMRCATGAGVCAAGGRSQSRAAAQLFCQAIDAFQTNRMHSSAVGQLRRWRDRARGRRRDRGLLFEARGDAAPPPAGRLRLVRVPARPIRGAERRASCRPPARRQPGAMFSTIRSTS
jgi:hypothetical protein